MKLGKNIELSYIQYHNHSMDLKEIYSHAYFSFKNSVKSTMLDKEITK